MFLEESCTRLFTLGRHTSGFYNIRKADDAPLPRNESYIRAWCDMDEPRGGWILLQQRRNMTFNFYRNWISYENGFGKPGVGYWIGNSYIHAITFKRNYLLRIELPANYQNAWRNQTRYAHHDSFRVLGPSTNYVLQVGKFQGDLADILSDVNNSAFSTLDRDNDNAYGSCARVNRGAWWYGKSCFTYDLNNMVDGVEIEMKVKELFGGKCPQYSFVLRLTYRQYLFWNKLQSMNSVLLSLLMIEAISICIKQG